MAFLLPTFNLQVNIWRAGNGPPNPPDVATVGNLTPGRRHITPYALEPGGPQVAANMFLLLPRGTDIRDAKAATGDDLVEVPAGSGRFYMCRFVDDVAFGFSNEHRLAQLEGFGPWPVPFPFGNAPLLIVPGATCLTAPTLVIGTTYYATFAPGAQGWITAPFMVAVPPAPFHIFLAGATPGFGLAVFQGTCVLNTPYMFGWPNGYTPGMSLVGWPARLFMLIGSFPGFPGGTLYFRYDEP